ncbi:hypothetical protein BN2475_40101 [Paraburkholderia ribeironis]|uniref:Uncharacterized protein n=1 Tax=Paraburkholderia ribeironis TaxID=1247936 RepID=A0A1N7RJN0_9BURK|nr:hypothetical protein [Paraburkholderia ribeironis]SIT35295.1 hypothetical protein BN2475_40101 [Paraburkholderia ribeironis]
MATWADYQALFQQMGAQRQQQQQQAQQDRQRAQTAQQAYGQYLASLGQQPQTSQGGNLLAPPSQTPAPGQASQPMQQPGQSQGQMQTQGQSAMMGVGNQMPPPPVQQAYAAGVQAGMQHATRQAQQMQQQPVGAGGQPPPFRPMPASPPPQQAAPSALSTPPAPPMQTDAGAGGSTTNGPMSLQGAVQWMEKNNIAPEDRPAVLQQMMPMLDYQSKQQLAAAQEQDRRARERETAEYRRASLDARADSSAAGGWTLVTEASGKNYRLNTRTGEAVPVELGGAPASGLTKTGSRFTPGVGAGDVTDYGKPLTNTTWESNAQAIASGSMAPIPLSSRAKGAQEIMARVTQLNPDYDAKDYGTKAAAEKYWATGKGGQQVNTINTAFSHVGNLQETSRELKNGGVPAWNAFANRIADAAGQPAPRDFGAQKAIVAGEVVKAIVGAGGGTLEDRKEIQQLFDNANTPAQMTGVMQKVRELMAGKLEAMERQYRKSTGRDDFGDYLSPEAASYLPSDGKGAGASGGGGPVRVKSVAEARKLPSGTEFISPDGVTRRVP